MPTDALIPRSLCRLAPQSCEGLQMADAYANISSGLHRLHGNGAFSPEGLDLTESQARSGSSLARSIRLGSNGCSCT
jgi:hypothetical protein